ncbi:MAG: bifunctional hydroxymethylpyrimidine kinase/phosphomethylpyrimidine kinase, partial [Bacteroidales bacterium]|nr:bifunctional hydroxymethylpyrimidine kinase/phosphomethylpyrimidine kinase [Bacteroidales bacterium]
MKTKRPIILSIAGSDSGGGAGIQADLKAISAVGGYGCTAITAITAQNTLGVRGVYPVSAEALRQQLEAVGDDLAVAAVKIGMLPTAEQVEIVAQAIDRYGWRQVVLDPVMVATSGDVLVQNPVARAMGERLFGRCTLLTPNMAEAATLTGQAVSDEAGMQAAAGALLAQGARAVLVKGGHLSGESMTDWLYMAEASGAVARRAFTAAKVHTANLHGTGCTLSSAIATYLGLGYALEEAVEAGKGYISRAIAAAWPLGHG